MTLDVTKIQALCFDVDGTLRDTDELYARSFSRWLTPLAFMLPGRDARRAARRLVMRIEGPMNRLHHLADRLGLDDEVVSFSYFMKRVRRDERPPSQLLINGVRPMLERLAQKYPLAVVTARDERGTLAFLNHFGLKSFFKCVAYGQVTPYTKPYPDPVLWAAQQMGVAPEACLMIGDTTADIRAGRSAGAQTVGVLCGFGEEPELWEAGAQLVLPTTADLLNTL